MSDRDLSRFYDSLATLLTSGLTVDRGLDTMKAGKTQSTLWMMDGLQDHVGRGGSLWEGMKHHRKFFDDFQVNIVKAAEESGHLPETFQKLSKYYENRYQTKRRFLAGLLYPMVLLHALILLPPLRYLVVPTPDRSYWSIVLPPLLIGYGSVWGVYMLWTKFLRSGPLRERVDEFIVFLPVVGKLVRDIALARAFWSTSAMLAAGVEVVKAAKSGADSAGNTFVAQRLHGALYVLEGGRSFNDYFTVCGMLSADQLAVVTVGEEAGAMAESMDKLTRRMESDNRERFNKVMKSVGVFIYIVVVIMVVMTIISFYSSYFSF